MGVELSLTDGGTTGTVVLPPSRILFSSGWGGGVFTPMGKMVQASALSGSAGSSLSLAQKIAATMVFPTTVQRYLLNERLKWGNSVVRIIVQFLVLYRTWLTRQLNINQIWYSPSYCSSSRFILTVWVLFQLMKLWHHIPERITMVTPKLGEISS